MKKSKIYPWYFAIGALIIYSALYVLPGLVGIGYSFTDWSSYSTEVHFVGLENFRQILGSNESYMKYIGNTLLFTVVTTVMKTGLALIFALALSKDIKLKNFHRGVMYMPSVLSILIIGLVFTSILNPKTGLLNEFLRTIGMEGLTQKWLTDPKIAFFSVMGVDVWRGTGYIMTIHHLLRGCRDRRSGRMEEVYEDNPAAAAANTGSHCCFKCAVRPEGVRYGIRPDQRRTRTHHRGYVYSSV